MTDFLSLLAITYLCNATAEQRMMAFSEALHCANTYEQVKRHFLPTFTPAPIGTKTRSAQNVVAYLEFKNWEADNPELVADLKARANEQARKAAVMPPPPG